MLAISNDDFQRLTGFIKENYGINLTRKKTLIEGRLSNYVTDSGYKSFDEYINYALSDKTGHEITVLINRLTTNHTYFMRESRHFEYLRDVVLPYLSSHLKEHDLRIWSAGCSSGEEPYTLEMLLHDHFGGEIDRWNTQILATDISGRALEIAQKGIYAGSGMEDIPTLWKSNYFERIDAEHYKVKDKIRNDVIFRNFNLMTEQFPFRKKFHVIFCRNVMIYFEQETKNALINKFYDWTEPGGYLFIGFSETVNRENTRYNYVMPAVYRKPL